MEKNNFRFLILPALFLITYMMFNLFNNNTNQPLSIYKESYVFDCYNNKKKPDNAIDLTDELKNINLTNDINKKDLYEKMQCVSYNYKSLNNYFEINDYKINHIKGINNKSYQLSYKEILNQLDDKKDKSSLDKKIINALSYSIKNQNANQFIGGTKLKLRSNSNLIGPSSKEESGTFKLVLDIKIVENNIYKLVNNKKVLDKTYYLFDDVATRYVRVVD